MIKFLKHLIEPLDWVVLAVNHTDDAMNDDPYARRALTSDSSCLNKMANSRNAGILGMQGINVFLATRNTK